MKLMIVKKQVKDLVNNTQCLSTDMLSIKSTHLFIASNKWDEIVVEVIDDIPMNTLKWIGSICQNVKVILPDTITEKTLHLLIELYPTKSGLLRKNYLQGSNIREVLRDEVWSDLHQGLPE